MPEHPHPGDIKRRYHAAKRLEGQSATTETDGVRVVIDHACGCLAPRYLEQTARPYVDRPDNSQPLVTTTKVRCRKCQVCRAAKARLWRHRGYAEASVSPSNFHVTLTFNSREYYRLLLKAQKYLRHNGVEWADITDAERFSVLEREAWRVVSLWIKRLRKELGAHSVRYLAIAEATESRSQQDFCPHYHIILHGGSPDYTTDTINYVGGSRMIEGRYAPRRWKHGFMAVKRVKDHARHNYVLKTVAYVTKFPAARIRASLQYGAVSLHPDVEHGRSELLRDRSALEA